MISGLKEVVSTRWETGYILMIKIAIISDNRVAAYMPYGRKP